MLFFVYMSKMWLLQWMDNFFDRGMLMILVRWRGRGFMLPLEKIVCVLAKGSQVILCQLLLLHFIVIDLWYYYCFISAQSIVLSPYYHFASEWVYLLLSSIILSSLIDFLGHNRLLFHSYSQFLLPLEIIWSILC